MVTILNKKPVYWECTLDGHNKFWAAQIIEDKSEWILLRKWGAIGTEGQKMEQTYNDRYEAEKVLERLIWEKESKGYKPIF